MKKVDLEITWQVADDYYDQVDGDNWIPRLDQLLATIREGFDGSDFKKGKASDLLHRVKCDEIVILDDIGAEKPSEWVEEQLYSLIDLRYRMERATIFTTNCSIPKELEQQIGERAVSRIFEMTEGIKVDGPDYRKRKLA